MKGAGNWAGGVAQTTMDRDEAARQQRQDVQTAAARLHAGVTREGLVWLARVTAAFADAAAAFNARLGTQLLHVSQLPTGTVSLLVPRDRRFVQVAPDWRPDDARYQPGVTVIVSDGRESTRPFRFILADDVLLLDVDGQRFTPEELARSLAEPFLSSLSLNGH